ncbi:MAG: hypothetical protein H0W68_00755 [Gemmatimonadaceae bacterium]|nr:hypothetical protein [Gemmatimonadaceae bacterium]
MSTNDKRPSIVALPGSVIDVDASERGGADAAELASAQRAIADASTRAPSQAIAVTAEVIERRKLIIEIRMMKRHRINVAVAGVIRGAMYTGAAWLLYNAGQWLLDELRRPPTAPPAPPATTAPESDQRTDSQSTGRVA